MGLVKRDRRFPGFFRIPWLWGGLVLALSSAAFLALLPYGIAYGIKQVLRNAGMQAVDVADVDFNPFTGHLKIHSLKAAVGGRGALSIPAADIRFAWWPLWQRRIYVESAAVHDLFLTLALDDQGTLQLAGIPVAETSAAPGKWSFHAEKLRLDGRLAYNAAGLKGTLAIDEATLTKFSSGEAAAHLEVRARLERGRLHLRADLAPFAAKPKATGDIRLARIPLSSFAPALSPRIRMLSGKLDGQLAFTVVLPTAEGEGRLTSVTGALAVDDVRVVTGNGAAYELQAQHIELGGVNAADTTGLGADRIHASGLQLADATKIDEPSLRIAAVEIEQLLLNKKQGLHAKRIAVANAEGWLARDAQGHWRLGGVVLPAGNADVPPPPFRLGNLMVSNSRLHVRDEAVVPPFASLLTIHKASIADVDSRNADRPSPFALKARVDKFASIELAGEAQPFAKPPGLKLRGNIKQLSLPPFSAYAVKELGYQLKTGQMDADVEVTMHQGRLEGISKLVLRWLAIAPENPSLMQQLTGKLSMSLDGALDLLRDSKGTITLTVPFSGDLTHPRFDFSDAINQALGKALQQAAFGYLTYALQPYGAFIAGAQLVLAAGKKVLAVRVDPLLFPAGSADLPAEKTIPYLQRLAGVLTQRPALQIRLCGRASPADAAAIAPKQHGKQEEALLALAQRRAEAVKAALVQDFHIDAKRLFLCLPEYDAKPDALPRVDVFLD